MTFSKKYVDLTEAFLCSFFLVVFSFFISYSFPLKAVAFAALLPAAYLLGHRIRSSDDLKKIMGEPASSGATFFFVLTGITCGIPLALLYRHYLGISVFPLSLHYFVIMAALIGSVEELVFRGFLQYRVRSINAPFSIIFSAVSHTLYKCFLFMAPVVVSGINIPNLALYTFLAGLLFGTVRHLSKSIIPSLIAHALFDVLVYAEFVKAPWWVW